MAFIGALIATVKADVNPFKKGMKDARKSTKKFRSDLASLSKTAFKFGAVVAGAATAAGLLAIKYASDFAEAEQKFGVVFQSVSDKSALMRDELVKNFGLSKTAATELLSSTGDLLTGFGFTDDAALELSNSVQELATDLASFSNLQGGTARASEIITKALLGERDSLVSLGVKISEADLQQRLLIKGQKELTGVALRAAKAQATYELIIEQTGKAQGDFARSSDSMANTVKTATARFDDLITSLGTKLLPLATAVAQEFLSLEESTLSWVTANDKLIDTKIDEYLQDIALALGKTLDALNLGRAAWNFLSIGVKSFAASLAAVAQQQEIVDELTASALVDLKEMEESYAKFDKGVNESKAKEVFHEMSGAIKEVKKELSSLSADDEERQKSKKDNIKLMEEELILKKKAIELEKQLVKEREKVISEAERIFEQTRTPLESVESEITRIMEMLTKGLDKNLEEGLLRKLAELKKEREKLKSELDETITISTGEGMGEIAEEVAEQIEKIKSPLEKILEDAEGIMAGFNEVNAASTRVGGFKEIDLKNIDIKGLDRSGDFEKQTLDENKKTNILLEDISQKIGSTSGGLVAL